MYGPLQRSRRWRRALLSAFLVVGSVPAGARAGTPPARAVQERPALGLVLSGGGARGLAHVGVLRWLEENRVPVDYVAGTSMGGMIGAMFALGMSPAEMTALVVGADWNALFRDGPGYQNASVRRQEDWRLFPAGVEFGLKDGIRLPSGLTSGHTIGLLLDRLAFPTFDTATFDDLRIPFACLATDLVEGRPVVIRSGSLSQALRATMAVPALLAPVLRDGMVLVDGGILNNLPTDVVRDMGAEQVVAVNVGTPLAERGELDSLGGILGQMVAMTGLESDRRNLALADLVIVPEMDASSLDFQLAAAIVESGYQAAERARGDLERFALEPEAWERHRQVRERPDNVPFEARSLQVLGSEEPDRTMLERRLGHHLETALDLEALEEDLNHIVGEGRFDAMGYGAGSADTLGIHAVPVRHGPPFLTLGLNVVGTSGETVTEVGGRYTAFDVGGYGSELRVDGLFGTEARAGIEYYRPIPGGPFFVAPRISISGRDQPLILGPEQPELRTRMFSTALEFGVSTGWHSQLAAGYEAGHRRVRIQDGSLTLSSFGGQVRDSYLRWVHDTRNDPTLPTSGVRVEVESRWYSRDPEISGRFARSEAGVSGFLPVGTDDTLFAAVSGGTGFGTRLPEAHRFTLGGPFRLGGFQPRELLASRYILTASGYFREIGPVARVPGATLNLAIWHEYGWLSEPGDEAVGRHAGSAGVILELPVGSLWVIGSAAEGGRRKAYFVIGRAF